MVKDPMDRTAPTGTVSAPPTNGPHALRELVAFSFNDVFRERSLVDRLILRGLHGGAFLVALFLIWWRDHANVVHPLQRLMRRIAR